MWGLFAVIGCGEKPVEPPTPTLPKAATVAVSGKVTYQGKPVANAAVTLFAVEGGLASRGTTDAAGLFKLSTYASNDGAAPGKYKAVVAVSTVTEIEPGVLAPEPEGGFKSPIPAKYADPTTTDLSVEIPAGGTDNLVIDLK